MDNCSSCEGYRKEQWDSILHPTVCKQKCNLLWKFQPFLWKPLDVRFFQLPRGDRVYVPIFLHHRGPWEHLPDSRVVQVHMKISRNLPAVSEVVKCHTHEKGLNLWEREAMVLTKTKQTNKKILLKTPSC